MKNQMTRSSAADRTGSESAGKSAASTRRATQLPDGGLIPLHLKEATIIPIENTAWIA